MSKFELCNLQTFRTFNLRFCQSELFDLRNSQKSFHRFNARVKRADNSFYTIRLNEP